ncbi:GTP-binding protein [Pantoea sp. Tr-811]|uniref:GTP-binding protein n=1 Tax=Pantoea sp. Tr-811 TaxID=2608361 RepID=UPI001423BBB8|nr:GTP-binding protein [Pantoea sp. Tr-811]NIF27497.1 GTP-binding protein [Pantoea sp. Tr-811]
MNAALPDVSVTDLAPTLRLLKRLATINPAAQRWESQHGQLDASKIVDLGLFTHQGKAPDRTGRDPRND